MDLASWFGAGILLAAFLFIPLSALAATGSWARAWEAARQYLKIMGALVVVGAGLGISAAVSEHGFGFIWSVFTGR